MTEQTETQLTPRQVLETKLNVEGLTSIAECLGKIVSEPIGDDLIRRVEGASPNWKRAIELADIVFGSETRTLDQKGKKPWRYLIEITAKEKKEVMNARMVGQVIQQLVSFAELSRNTQQLPTQERKEVLDNAQEAVSLHFQAATWKDRRKKTMIQGQPLKAIAEESGVTLAQGLDGASPNQLLHIIEAIKERADNITPKKLEENNAYIRKKVKRPLQK
ncbi:MAG TPA: hypothetical protein VMW29_01820 [Candidatus Bathyarchaeia archaeon]|nr:hypothetical protein [Candidatus Bathyarchaeia archaeon]